MSANDAELDRPEHTFDEFPTRDDDPSVETTVPELIQERDHLTVNPADVKDLGCDGTWEAYCRDELSPGFDGPVGCGNRITLANINGQRIEVGHEAGGQERCHYRAGQLDPVLRSDRE